MIVTTETYEMAILAAPVAVVALAGLTVLLLLFRQKKAALSLGACALLLNFSLEQIPLNLRHEVPAEKPAGTLRIMAYNICGKVEYAALHDASFVAYIKAWDADVLFLPENSAGTCPGLEEMLQANYPYSVHDMEGFPKSWGNNPDRTLYSRYPLSDFRTFKVNRDSLLAAHPYLDSTAMMQQDESIMAVMATANVHGKPVTLLHVHLRSNGYDWVKLETQVPGKRRKVHNVYDKLLFGYAFREAEADTLARALRDCPNPLLIAGDFNDFCGSRCVTTLQHSRDENPHPEHRDRLHDAWWEGGQGFGFTFAAQHLRLRLDHILFSEEFELQAVSTPKVPYSDHRPIVADFKCKFK